MRSLFVLVVAAGCGDNIAVTAPDAAPDAPLPAPVFAQTAYIKSTRPIHDAHFGKLGLSGNGDTLVVAQPDSVSVYANDGTWRVAGELLPAGATFGFGTCVAISSDGSTIAVGAENSVSLFRSDGTAWIADARLLGGAVSVALSSDGSTLVVGSRNASTDVGTVRTYQRAENAWSELTPLFGGSDDFGFARSLAVAPDGSVLAATAYRTSANDSVVHVFARNGVTWVRRATLAAPDQRPSAGFGISISCSARCETIAIGADQPPPMLGAPGMEGTGVAFVFEGDGTAWTPTATLTASNADIGDRFGVSLAIAADGSTIVVGAQSETSAATGIGGDAANNGVPYAGAAYVFRRHGAGWPQVLYLKGSNTESLDLFGSMVAVANDGTTIVVAAQYENGGSSGVDGDQSDNSQPYAGAAYAFEGTY
jgi:trimeric autotransporter adhesin